MFRNRGEFGCALRALERRDYPSADEQLTVLLERPGRTPSERAYLFNKRGVARIALGRRELGHEDFAAALEAQPRYAPALTNLGNLLLESGRLEEAISRYEQAIASDADHAVAHFNLGVAYKRVGRVAEGVRALRHAERLEARRFSRQVRAP